jgi:hypothetical protein
VGEHRARADELDPHTTTDTTTDTTTETTETTETPDETSRTRPSP